MLSGLERVERGEGRERGTREGDRGREGGRETERERGGKTVYVCA